MATLTTEQRKKLPAAVFAGPGRSFPIPDKFHAVAAERLVGRSVAAGNTTESEASKIKAKAKRVLAGRNMIARPKMKDTDKDGY